MCKNEYLKIYSQNQDDTYTRQYGHFVSFFLSLSLFFFLAFISVCIVTCGFVKCENSVYLVCVQTPLPYNGIVVEFFFSLHLVSSIQHSAIEVSNKLFFPNSLSNYSRTGEQHDKAESKVLLVQGMNKFFLKSFTLFQPRNISP